MLLIRNINIWILVIGMIFIPSKYSPSSSSLCICISIILGAAVHSIHNIPAAGRRIYSTNIVCTHNILTQLSIWRFCLSECYIGNSTFPQFLYQYRNNTRASSVQERTKTLNFMLKLHSIQLVTHSWYIHFIKQYVAMYNHELIKILIYISIRLANPS